MGDTNLSSDASAGDLCMLIFIDLAHLFMRQGHCLSTHCSTKLAVIPSYAMGPGNIAENATKAHPSICVSTCSHLPPSRISHHHASPLAHQGQGGGVGWRGACGRRRGLYVWVGVPPGTLFVKLVNSRRSHCRQAASTQRCRAL